MQELLSEYERILKGLDIEAFSKAEDHYSGVFLPIPFAEYWTSDKKIMLIGRETAGWNTENKKNTMQRIADHIASHKLDQLVREAVERYKGHLKRDKSGKIKTKDKSRFKQYFFRLARELNVRPEALLYGNIFAWDYNKKSPRTRPAAELEQVVELSLALLAAQIRCLKPDVVIFAGGYKGIERLVKQLFLTYFTPYETIEVIPRKYWEFKVGDMLCFCIAHPRANRGHAVFRAKVILRIQECFARC